MGTIFCFGESMVMLYPQDMGTELQDTLYFKRNIGGSACISAYSVACLGGCSGFIGTISSDGLGKFIRYTLKSAGVNLTAYISDDKNKTPIILLHETKESKAIELYRPITFKKETQKNIFQILTKEDILLLSPQGSYLEVIEAAIEAQKTASRTGCLLSINLGIEPTKTADMEGVRICILEKLEFFDIVFVSDSVLSVITGNNSDKDLCDTINRIPLLICFKKNGNVVIYKKQKDDLLRIVNTFSVQSVNSVNQQSVFAGAFLHRIMIALNNDNLEEILNNESVILEIARFAAASVAVAGKYLDGLLPFPAKAEVDKLVSKNSGNNGQIKEFRRLAEIAKTDYYRLKYHIMPEAGWMNDPNGLIQYKGKYHVFYQTYPYASVWGPMHWGHVVSEDLVHWEYLPFALTPDQPYEKGCYSGSAVDNNGELTLIYTAHDDARSPKEVQCIAFSTDGIKFRKYDKNPVITMPPTGFGEDFRDPKVFKKNDIWYLAAGCTKDKHGGMLIYRSKDLRNWKYLGLACKSDGEQGDMWECPDLFELENNWVILTSPMNMKTSKVIFITGTMDFNTVSFTQKQCYDVDYGFEFYSPQTFNDDKGRRILIGWMDIWMGEYPTQKSGWSGALTFPRELFIKDGRIHQKPVEELKLLRKKELFNGNLSLTENKRGNLPNIKGDCNEISFSIPGRKFPGLLTLYIRSSKNEKEKTVLNYNFDSRVFTLDKRQSGAGRPSITQITLDNPDENIPVHILIDRSSVEVFLDNGKYAITHRIYPHPSSLFYDIFIEGCDLEIPDLNIFELG